ncbi:hypothetical protein G7B40_031325 [Aetokthonos hydrillicola Thurmond2011]|jgi:hypothetical protein|uniref:Uncharacterized protein n=1 Tax=Aetokthonos hydrillicola Thurmond2011 TaxID=2712845 RepID=A0AAP5ICA5_9CYAN|nr:Rad52/Rad22 family DNA repair protein [Aetokthonos hydrillicola]MBO3463266.1 hypothetical protein [Aetokthonos hydrillicola CCALA 1050]MBW4590509.1 hypothetical protein [Aetokthonos hydrillicola CCALA 1050]MDR9899017.1 hypothetical protein [Aetokthonos hydrillicola Thurmond2011]
MLTTEIREELTRIQVELKKVFPPEQHEIRDLPGNAGRWVYLRWQTIRERLDAVCPDWSNDHSEIQYLENEAVCRCGITILGVRKEAIASVPISLVSGKGKEMTRGSPADRLAAEGLKNAAEIWGVGRYLDDQKFVIHYLSDRLSELDENMQGEVRKLCEQYKIYTGVRQPQRKAPENEGSFLHALAGTNPTLKISQRQRNRLWAIGKSELKLSDDQIKSAYKELGFEKCEDITPDKYEQVVERLRSLSKAADNNVAPVQDLYPANNNIVRQIRSITKHQPDWILAQCKRYGYERPGAIPPEQISKLLADMCSDYAYTNGAVESREGACTSFSSAIAFAQTSGQPILQAALDWLGRHQGQKLRA